MGLDHLIPTVIAYLSAVLYMIFIGRYRLRYGFFPALAGILIDVGIRKTLIYFIIPQIFLLSVTFGIARYAYSFILGERQGQMPLSALSKLIKVICSFNMGATKDARYLVQQLAKQKTTENVSETTS